jgi:hypothetical protein
MLSKILGILPLQQLSLSTPSSDQSSPGPVDVCGLNIANNARRPFVPVVEPNPCLHGLPPVPSYSTEILTHGPSGADARLGLQSDNARRPPTKAARPRKGRVDDRVFDNGWDIGLTLPVCRFHLLIC